MIWWILGFLAWAVSAAWIIYILAEVFRGKISGRSPSLLPGYGFHAVFAVLSVWFFFKALT